MTTKSNCFLLFITLLGIVSNVWSSGVGGYSASNTFTVTSGNATNPTYMIASASISGDPVYTGVVDAVTSSNVTFATGTDENNNTIYPFAGNNVFDKDVQLPILTSNAAGSSITSITYFGAFDSNRGFDAAPDIMIDAPSGAGVASTATCTINAQGEIISTSVTAGSGYTEAPKVKIVGGPHFLRNTTLGSANYGRYFLISTNTQTSLTLDYSRIAHGESSSASSYFSVGDTVEIIPAPTMGSIFGTDTSDLPTGWSYGLPDDVDWVYLYDSEYSAYFPYSFLGSTYEPSWPRGWYSVRNLGDGVQNNQIIYPDEAFLISKRTSNNATFIFEGTVQTNDQQLFLPAGDKQILTNNPYGTDLMLCELIPSTSIGSGTTKFNPGSSATDTNMDKITLLQSGTWTTYYYDSGSASNPSVTAMHEVATRKLTSGSMAVSDFYIGHGDITNLESCSATGDTAGIGGNDSNYTKITISAGSNIANALPTATDGLNGFMITLSSIQGYDLNEDGTSEVDENGTNVADGSGVVVYSNLNGTHQIVDSASGYIVIEKIRDINLKSNEQDTLASNATANWAIGSKGSGYNGNAKFYCIGGGGPDANHATACVGVISSTGGISSVSGSGSYSSAPQAIVSGGGWRTSSSGTSSRGNEVVGATDGVFISRGYSSGVKTFLASSNPNN